MIGRPQFSAINAVLNAKFAAKKALIAVHRGSWGGNIIENTVPAFELACEMGADMFELDISQSTDGVLYAFHDGGEDRLLGIERNIQTLSSAEIEALTYRNCLGQESRVKVARFIDIARHFQGEVLYNIDRAWPVFPALAALLEGCPWALRQVLIKSPPEAEYLSFWNEWPKKYMYMPIVTSMAEVRRVLAYPNLNVVGMELIAASPQSELFQQENIQWILDQGLFAWANAITLSAREKHILFGGLDDDRALLRNRDSAWGGLLQKGIGVMQTDWPFQLKKYRDAYFGLSDNQGPKSGL